MMNIVEGREVMVMGGFGHGWGMMASMFVFWALVLGAGLWLLARLFPVARVPQVHGQDARAAAVDPAVQVARQRYASGELTTSEYEEVLRALKRIPSAAGDGPREA